MTTTLTGLYADADRALRTMDRLLEAGVEASRISVIAADTARRQDLEVEESSRVGDGAAIGAGTGGAAGALVAGLTSVGVVATGGVGLLAAGPVVAALAGAGAGAAGGGAVGALIGAGVPEHHAKFLDEEASRGRVLVAVTSDDDRVLDRAKKVFDDSEAIETSRV